MSLTACNFDAPVSALISYLVYKKLPIKTWGCLTLMAIMNYSCCIPKIKNKHEDMLNSPPDMAKLQEINTTK